MQHLDADGINAVQHPQRPGEGHLASGQCQGPAVGFLQTRIKPERPGEVSREVSRIFLPIVRGKPHPCVF